MPVSSSSSTSATANDTGVNFNRLSNLSQPTLPDMTDLTAALSTLDGQVMSLQQQLNATQEALQAHDAEVAKTANQLRTGVRKVSERMDNTIADVARTREALAWAELLQLMEDVMNNPRDIEYVTKLARKARELNKVFQLHQSVLNTMAECNSLLRSMISEDNR
jgi:leucyl aminopeptidase